MSKIKNLYLVRHGETDWNRDKRIQGQSDIPLNDLGREQSKQLASRIPFFKIQSVFSSDLSRAYETAQIAMADSQLTIQKDIRFREAHLGEAEGLTPEEIMEKYSESALTRWRSYDELDLDYCFPKGESKRKIMVRVRDAVLEVIKNSQHDQLMIFTHGILMRALTHAFNQGTEFDLQLFSNGSIHKFEWNEERPDYLKYTGKIEDNS